MLFSGYYNKENECLIISSNSKVVKKQVDNGDVYFFDEENKIVGANIFISGLEAGLTDLNQIDDPRLVPFKNEEAPFVYGLIQSVEDHPESDHLHICQVKDKVEKQIVCGAKNVEANKVGIVAQIGAVMPNGMSIVPSKLLKVESIGMMCSLNELGKSDEKNGIFLSDDQSLVGKPVF